MHRKLECSDELLLGILNQNAGCSTELDLQHLDNCEHCQARIEELAANEQQWALARDWCDTRTLHESIHRADLHIGLIDTPG